MVAPLDIDGVEVRGGALVPASDAEVDALEDQLGVEFPDGYRAYVTRLGEGTLNDFVRVLPPWRILTEVEVHRGTMAADWFWDTGNVPFGQEQATESIPLADTLDGDVIAFHPDDRAQLIVLPRNRDRVYARGPDLLEAINWMCSGGTIRRFGPARHFEPFDSRVAGRETVAESAVRASVSASVLRRPRSGMSPRDVLMAYFADLLAVEEWAFANEAALFPDLDDEDDDDLEFDEDMEQEVGELILRSDEVHARYCTPRLAGALSGASVSVSRTPEHEPSAIRVIEEKEDRSGHVVIQTAQGHEFVFLHKYVLERSGDEWWINSHTQGDLIAS
jgi:hypothetical protein